MKKIYYILILILNTTKLLSQDMHFTQFYASSLYLNPAFTGANVCSRFSLTYRDQWPGVSKAYKTFLASYDHFLTNNNLGIGLLIGNDVAGTGQLNTTVINPLIAYEVKLTNKVFLRFGAQPGLTIKSINANNLVFGDQIARGGNVAPLQNPTQSKVFFDMGAGALIFTRKFWGGISFFHLNTPNETLLGGKHTSELPIKYSIHAGYKHIINPDEVEISKQRTFTPTFNYRAQREFDQLDIGCYYTINILNFGMWYRGLPGIRPYKPHYRNDDAIGILIGLKYNQFNLGYSYDFTISKLTPRTLGANELTMSYQMCKLKKKKKKPILVACPKF